MAQKPKSLDGIFVRPGAIRLVKNKPGLKKPQFISLQPTRPIDGILPRPQRNHPNSVASTKKKPIDAPIKPGLPAPTVFQKPSRLKDKDVVVQVGRGHSLRATLGSVVQYVALAAIALLAAYSTGIGQWFILAYAILAIGTRRSSQLTFGIALFLLISVPLFQVLGQTGVADNMAVYVYELLVVGTIQAVIELKWPLKTAIKNT